MVQKSRDAFRTISEVAEWLDVPTHVLRFWESRFSQIKPVKRAGGRRYYRPSDMRVIGGVKTLLHDQGMTIRGVQKLFREEGVKHVSSFSAALDGEAAEAEDAPATIEAEATPVSPAAPAATSRDATPSPIIDAAASSPTVETEDDAPIVDQAPVFAHTARATAESMVPRTAETPDNQRAGETGAEAASEDDDDASTDSTLPFLRGEETAAEAEAPPPEPEAAPEDPAPEPPRPSIPPTPNVPENDPDDDDPAFAAPPGVAARLRLTAPEALAAHRADLIQTAERLKAILERAE